MKNIVVVTLLLRTVFAAGAVVIKNMQSVTYVGDILARYRKGNKEV